MRILVLLGVLLGAAGCGAEMKSAYSPTVPAEDAGSIHENTMLDSSEVSGQVDAGEGPAENERLVRKIIYTADLQLVVEQFAPIPSQIAAVVKQFDAYIARSNFSGVPGASRHGEWTIRVPVDRYDACLETLRRLGEIQKESADSKDVSEEFYDLNARTQNKQKQEERLLELLSKATGKLEEVLRVEAELARVRGEIEQMTGKLRVLSDLTAMATIRLTIREIANYVPPEAPHYTTRVQRAFNASLSQLVTTAQNGSILMVMAAPWLVVLTILAPLVWGMVRLFRRK